MSMHRYHSYFHNFGLRPAIRSQSSGVTGIGGKQRGTGTATITNPFSKPKTDHRGNLPANDRGHSHKIMFKGHDRGHAHKIMFKRDAHQFPQNIPAEPHN